MTFQVQQKRSLDKNRRPSPKDLLDGQLAVNLHTDSPGIFFRDGTGQLIKAGPVHVGDNPPVTENWSKYSVGELWYDTRTGTMNVRTKVGWESGAGAFTADAERIVKTLKNPSGRYFLSYDFGTATTHASDPMQIAALMSINSVGGFSAYETTVGGRLDGLDASVIELGTLREALKTSLEARLTTNDGLIATLLSDVASNTAAITLVRSDFETADTLSGNRIFALETTSNSLVSRVTTLEQGGLATSAYVDARIASLLDGAPAALDTLNELAAAFNDDPNTVATLTSQINAVQADVDQNETDSDAADAALSARLDALEADPTTQTLLSAEAATRSSADTALSARITTLEADPTTATALAAVQADVDQNELDSDAAEAALSGRIATLEADPTTQTLLDAETTARTNADAALSGRLDTLEADPTTATALAAVQADVDQNETDSDAADAALSGRIAVFELDPGPNGATFTELDTNVDDLITLSGVAENSTHLGAFTGTTITDDQTVKAALQELETALEGHIPVLVEVHNQTGSDIAKGTPVYVSGTHTSGKPKVDLADSDGSATYPAIGLVHETITDGTDGLVNISGFLDGIDTDTPAWDAGTALYLDSTAGALTSTRPTSSAEKVQKVAIVARRHQTSGSVIVMGAGRTNDVPNELTALTGVALNATNLGTFSGSTIADSETVKGALQDLETEVETKLDNDAATVRTLLGIGEYADDAAAGTGGVASGAMYYNTTSSDYRLKS